MTEDQMEEKIEILRIAGAALEAALNASKPPQVIEVAEQLVILSASLIRGLVGVDYVREFLQAGIKDLDNPTVHVVRLDEPTTKH
jgi:hypothetical protein